MGHSDRLNGGHSVLVSGPVTLRYRLRLGVFALCLALSLVAPVRSDAITVHDSGYWTSLFSSTAANGMEIDPAGNLFFLMGAAGVQKATPSGTFSTWSGLPVYEMALTPTGEAYATGGSCACIQAIRADGTLEFSRVDSTGWTDLAVTRDGALYGLNWRGSLARFDRTTLEATTIILGGPGPGGTGGYGGIAGGSDGKLYVTGTLDNTMAGWRLFRLDGSQLVVVATLPHGAGVLVPGPSGTFFGLTGFDYGSGYSVGEVWQVDTKTGTSELLVTSGSYFHNNHPTFHSLAYDSTRATLYVGEGGLGSGTWAITKIPPVVVTWGEGSVVSVDTTEVILQWPVQVQVNWLVDIFLERRTENGSFSTIDMNRASDGQVSFADRTVIPGTRYAYRVGAAGDSGFAYSGVLWVDIPALTPPPPPIQIWSGGTVTVDTSSVTLDWPINPIVTGDVRIERRVSDGIYGSIASVHLVGDGHVHLVDETVLRGASYVYRAGVPSDTGWVWSGELTANVPAVSVSPPPVQVWGKGAVSVDSTSVALDWFIDPAMTGYARVERRVPDGIYGSIASVHLAGDGHVHLVDEAVLRGMNYVYRAGVPSDTGWVWSEELSANIPADSSPTPPAHYALAFVQGASVIARASIEVEFTVPTAGTASIEAFDVTGRRVAVSRLDTTGAGAYTAPLTGGGSLKPGIYFLRLTQGALRAQSRVIVLGSR